MEKRMSQSTIETNEEKAVISARFIVFDSPTELFTGYFEQVKSEAVDISGDVVSLFDHNTGKVLGRTKNQTLKLRKENDGIYGDIYINEKDTEAMNIYERVKRGDISNCSFGFYIKDYIEEERSDGSILITLTKVDLLEVSIVTFPAYENTEAKARFKLRREKSLQLQKNKLKERLNGIKSIEIKKRD